ncbi:MAG: chromosome partitioning protein ParB [Rhodospirillaceae bacterium]|nr:chromosome partitioning protein ParB [Rhodospirillaceae bacterium]
MTADQPSKGKRRKLGRGLSALFGEANVYQQSPATDRQTKMIPTSNIRPGPEQPRRSFDGTELKTLAESIKQKGILQPLLLRRMESGGDIYEIIAGERRWRAAQLAQIHEVPAVIGRYDEKEALEIGLIENIQRSDLSPLGEAAGFERLVGEYGYTQDQVSKTVGKSRSYIANSLRLLALPSGVKEHLESGRLTAGHARALLVARDAEKLAEYVVAGSLSVRATERLVHRNATEIGAVSPVKKRSSMSSSSRLDPDILALEKDIFEKLGLYVEIQDQGDRGGKVTIRYHDLDEFEYLLKKLAP